MSQYLERLNLAELKSYAQANKPAIDPIASSEHERLTLLARIKKTNPNAQVDGLSVEALKAYARTIATWEDLTIEEQRELHSSNRAEFDRKWADYQERCAAGCRW